MEMTMAADVDRDCGSRTGESSRATEGKSERVEELVRKWQGGDRNSGNILFTKYYSELLAFAHGLFPEPLRRRVDTVDVVQEACAAACESRAQFEYRDTSSFSRWLFTIVENKLWKRWQAERAQRRDIRRVRGLDESVPVEASEQTPSEQYSFREDSLKLKAAIKRLSPEHELVVTARYLEGKSWNEISVEFGKSKEAAQMLLIRALKKLREHLAG